VDWKLGQWSRGRAVVVFGVLACLAVSKCVAEASGWHGPGSMYQVTPFAECFFSAKLWILVAVGAVVLAWITRDNNAS
jgi:hypothetical protein